MKISINRKVGALQARFARAMATTVALLVGCTSAAHRTSALDPTEGPASEARQQNATLRASTEHTVILVVLDGVRWQDVFQGVDKKLADDAAMPSALQLEPQDLLPNLHRRLISGGMAIGAPDQGEPMHTANRSHVSLPGYMEMLTGVVDPTCDHNECPPVTVPTVGDVTRGLRGVKRGEVAFVASWEQIARAAARDSEGIAISAGRNRLVNEDLFNNDAVLADLVKSSHQVVAYPGGGDYRPDIYTAAIALRYLEVHHPRFMFVGLGDTDEWGHLNDYEAYLHSLRFADAVLGQLIAYAQVRQTLGHQVNIVVTTDHGRSDSFETHGPRHSESSRVWLAAWGPAIAQRGIVAASSRRTLADIHPTIITLLTGSESSAAGAQAAAIPELFEPQRKLIAGR